MRLLLSAREELLNAVDVLGMQDVVIRLLAIEVLPAGVDEAYGTRGLGLGEGHDVHRDGGAV